MAHLVSRASLLVAFILGVLLLASCSSSEDRAKSFYQSGLELEAKGEPIKAALEFRNALKLKADYVDARFALGNAEEEQRNYEAAVQAYQAVIEQDATHLQARVRLAYILMAASQLDTALGLADEALAIAPTDASSLAAKAAIELRLDNRGDAVRLATAAIARDPEFVDALMVLASERFLANDPAGALKFLDASSDKEADSNVGLQILRITALDAMGDQPGVEQAFGKLLKLFPDAVTFRDGLVKWYLSKGRNDDAERVVREFAANNPDDQDAQLRMVAFLNDQKGSVVAMAELQQLILDRTDKGRDNFPMKMALAQMKFAAGVVPEATDLLRTIISSAKLPEDQNRARILLARMLSESNDPSAAEVLADEVLATDAKNVDALQVRAALRLQTGKNAEAVDDLLVATNEAPDNAKLRGSLADAYERIGSATLAEEQYTKALALDQNSAETGLPMVRFLLRYGKVDQARRVLEAVQTRAPRDPSVLTVLAQLQLATGDWAGAQQTAATLRDLGDSASAVTADQVGAAALSGLNKHDDSIELLQTTLSTATDRQVVLADLIRAYVQAGRQPAAETYLTSLLETEPANVQARVLLGSVYLSMNDRPSAEKALREAVAVDNGVVASTALAQFYLMTGDLETAADTAREGLQRDETSIALRLLLATVYEGQQDFEAAIAEYQTMFDKDPESTVVANGLASLLSEREGTQEALDRAFEIAQRFRNSEIPQFLDTLGWIYYLRNDYLSALPLLSSAAERLSGVALVQLHLGLTQKQVGDDEKATATLERALTLTPPLFDSDREKAVQALAELKSPSAAPSVASE